MREEELEAFLRDDAEEREKIDLNRDGTPSRAVLECKRGGEP